MQLKHRLSIYNFWQKLHRLHVKILWMSQKKQLAYAGENIKVADLPTIQGAEYVSIGKDCFLGAGVRIEAWDRYRGERYTPQILVGEHVTLTERCYLSCIDRIVISNNVLMGRDVFISDNSHGTFENIDIPPTERRLVSKGPVIIGENVWIGRNSTVLSGVTIGDNVVIGANSIVNRDIPANCMAAGSPAKIIKQKSTKL